MKLGLVGLPQSGKSTVFAALTGVRGEKKDYGSPRGDQRIATITVADERLDFLTKIYNPKKTTHAKIEYLLPSEIPTSSSKSEGGVWNLVRPCDALLHVVRNFEGSGGSPAAPEQDFWQLEEDMILSDLVVAEKRIERIELDKKRGKKPEGEEFSLLKSCCEHLEKSHPVTRSAGYRNWHPNKSLRVSLFCLQNPCLLLLTTTMRMRKCQNGITGPRTWR